MSDLIITEGMGMGRKMGGGGWDSLGTYYEELLAPAAAPETPETATVGAVDLEDDTNDSAGLQQPRGENRRPQPASETERPVVPEGVEALIRGELAKQYSLNDVEITIRRAENRRGWDVVVSDGRARDDVNHRYFSDRAVESLGKPLGSEDEEADTNDSAGLQRSRGENRRPQPASETERPIVPEGVEAFIRGELAKQYSLNDVEITIMRAADGRGWDVVVSDGRARDDVNHRYFADSAIPAAN